MKFKKRIALCALMLALVAVLSFTLVACNGSLEQQIRDLQDKVNGFEQDFAEKCNRSGKDQLHLLSGRRNLRLLRASPFCTTCLRI